MKKTTFSAAISLILCVASCSSDDPTMSNLSMESDVPTTKNTRGSEETPILHFTDMLEFNNALTRIRSLNSSKEKIEWVHSTYPEFNSVQDIYNSAMIEMENEVDETEESYLNFKEKFNTLYFPMYGEDAGFYIPMSDLDAAYLVNENYMVNIGGNDICLKDIDNYNELMSTGRAYYEMPQPMLTGTMVEFSLSSTDINSVGPEYDSGWVQYDKRKVKLKARRRFVSFSPAPGFNGSKSLFHTEFCFRKKTIFGWSNSDSTSSISGTVKIPGTHDLQLNSSHSGTSSHDYDYEIPVFITVSNGYWVYTCPELTCNATVLYRGVAQALTYNWIMGGAYARTPYSANHATIVPCIEQGVNN